MKQYRRLSSLDRLLQSAYNWLTDLCAACADYPPFYAALGLATVALMVFWQGVVR